MSGLGRRTHYRKHLTDSVLYDYPEPSTTRNECLAKIIATRGSNQFDIQLAAAKRNTDIGTQQQQQQRKEYCHDGDDGDDHNSGENSTMIELAILPTKFRKLIWLKRNDYVIVQCATDNNTVDHNSNNNNNNNNDNISNVSNDNDTNNNNSVGKNHEDSTYIPIDDHVARNSGTTHDHASFSNISNSSKNNTNSNCNNTGTAAVGGGGGGIRYMITHILYKNQIQHLITKGLWPTHDSAFCNETTTTPTTAGNDNHRIVNENDDGIVYTTTTTNSNNHAKNNRTEGIQATDSDDVVVDDDDNDDESYNDDDGDDDTYTTDDDDDDDLFVNTNRMAKIELQDSDDE